MRPICLFFLFVFSFSLQAVFLKNTALADCTIITTLRLGSRGAEVQCLQGKVGIMADGSFGPLTKGAVIAFQAKHGLITDGIVGSKTRAALSGATSGVVGLNTNNDKKPESSKGQIGNTNPNLVNIDKFIEMVLNVSRKNGYSEEKLKVVSASIRKIAISNRDFRKEFDELLIKKSKEFSADFNNQSFLNKVVTKTFSFLGINPPVAQAAVGVPFGGAIIYTHPCEDGGWTIGISPLPPSFPAVLTYYSGSMTYLSYNLPFARFLLGDYIPLGWCTILPLGYPTEGTVTSFVGSSPL